MQSTGKIFWASFLTLIAAGMGFAIRSDVLAVWGEKFAFTKTDLGTITAFRLPVLKSGMGITQLVIDTPVDQDVIVKFRQFRTNNEWTVTLRPSTSRPARVIPASGCPPAVTVASGSMVSASAVRSGSIVPRCVRV